MPIVESTDVWGEAEVRADLPSVAVVADALVVPQRGAPHEDTGWGVYDRAYELVEEAALTRGPGRILVGRGEVGDRNLAAATLEGTYLYGGSAHGHYGHYLLEFLSRYWYAFLGSGTGCADRRGIVIHAMPGHAGWLSVPFVHQTLRALGLEKQDFLIVDEPVRVERLVVPAPSFVLQKRAYDVFSTMCSAIGDRLCGPSDGDLIDRPVFLSKERLTGGVWNIRNEGVFVEELRRAGIRVVHPETLSLEEQIALLRRHKTIGGVMGSALHTLVFCDAPKTILALGHDGFINSDFVLVDRIKRNRTRFYHVAEELIRHGPTPAFLGSFSFKDPEAAGAAFARLLWAEQGCVTA